MMVGPITDGGIIEIYVNDIRVDVSAGFMFRPNGIAQALSAFDISATPFDEMGNEIIEESEPSRYYNVARVDFQNLSSVYKRIRIVIIDANPVDTSFTPNNESFLFDEETNITTFCLSPAA